MPANEKEELQRYLAEGLSLEQIGKRVGRDPSTISYHLKKHRLVPVGHDVHAPNQKVDPGRCAAWWQVAQPFTKLPRRFGCGYSTIRYWLRKLGHRDCPRRSGSGSHERRKASGSNQSHLGLSGAWRSRVLPASGRELPLRKVPDGVRQCLASPREAKADRASRRMLRALRVRPSSRSAPFSPRGPGNEIVHPEQAGRHAARSTKRLLRPTSVCSYAGIVTPKSKQDTSSFRPMFYRYSWPSDGSS